MDKIEDKKKEILVEAIKNVKLQDAGVKDNEMDAISDSPSTRRREIRYPSLYLNTDEVPQLKGYEYGDKIVLVAECEITGHSEHQNRHNETESFDIKMKRIGCHKKSV